MVCGEWCARGMVCGEWRAGNSTRGMARGEWRAGHGARGIMCGERVLIAGYADTAGIRESL